MSTVATTRSTVKTRTVADSGDRNWASSIGWLAYAAATLIGAFLVFQVQPVISKCVLPWYGGTPSVWTTCLLFFQVLLFAGYLYAHFIKTYLSPRWQACVHLTLLAAAAWSLPIQPTEAWKPIGSENPTFSLLGLLAAHVAIPYFVLSSTGPLVQAWLAYEKQDQSVYRLYALSNAGSLAALLSYPLLVEPWFSISQQSAFWSVAFCAFVLVDGYLAIGLLNRQRVVSIPEKTSLPSDTTVTVGNRLTWVGLPALASVMLLVVTSHVCQDVAVIPFLWVVPLSLYLLTFIISFDSPHWYRPKLIASMAVLGFLVIATATWLPSPLRLPLEAIAYFDVLFCVALLCHGETARCKPNAQFLTQFYALISLGGALGGVLIALVCPVVFQDYRELPIALAISMALVIFTFLTAKAWLATRREGTLNRSITAALIAMVLFASTIALTSTREGTIDRRRNFFGVLRVEQADDAIQLVHGSTIHGLQLLGNRSGTPTSYYGTQSGVGKVITQLQSERADLRIGVVGLGCGVLATYGRPNDHFDLFEINPDVVAIANQHFSFLRDCPSQIQHHLGDGRLLLERQRTAKYDLIVLDAFTSDAIPAHLLTVEAMQLYRDRLQPDGVVALHLSNNHLDLVPLAHRLAQHVGWQSRCVHSKADAQTRTKPARWVIATARADTFWQSPRLRSAVAPTATGLAHAPLWTDQHHDLLSVLSW